MKQYQDLLRAIQEKGTYKPAAREGMPGTQSLFGYSMQFDLSNGFPILTTKKVKFEHIATELLWFLKGLTNVKWLRDRGVKIWDNDAFNYYKKIMNSEITKEQFVDLLDNTPDHKLGDIGPSNYSLGDCGNQYGRTWRNFAGIKDQISRVLLDLLTKPQGRRHLVSSIDPSDDEDLALYWCHAFFQFNARPISLDERIEMADNRNKNFFPAKDGRVEDWLAVTSTEYITKLLDEGGIPKYYLDCNMYQRSADVFLGVPYNISSYALLTMFFAQITGMIPGVYTHMFGDVHIYDNHKEQVNEILTRDPKPLPLLKLDNTLLAYIDRYTGKTQVNGTPDLQYYHRFQEFIDMVEPEHFKLEGYESHSAIKAELSTGTGKY